MTAGGRGPFRVAVIGSGPAGFYVAEHLLSREGFDVTVDMFERLPTPFGLVRFGVAPDHEKIKNVTRTFEKKTASNPGYRFFGNVDVGIDVTLDDLRRHYHAVCFASGAQTDRQMGIPGEDLARSHPATEFVAWYNGHPDFRDCQFDLSVERVAVVGVGNVAVDVARILCRTPEELASTDIADYALEALTRSNVKEVHMLGRRGPAQAAFTNPEVRELGQMPGANVTVLPAEAQLDPLSREAVETADDRSLRKKLEIIESFTTGTLDPSKPRNLTIRFLVSPTELIGDTTGGVCGMTLVKNELYQTGNGSLRPRATERTEQLPVDLVFRSVGYHGLPISGLPFDERSGVVPNDHGRVMDGDTHLTGLYVSGWIKRGPTGVIGTNKPDALETVECIVADAETGVMLQPESPDRDAVTRMLAEKEHSFVSYEDWKLLDKLECDRGAGQNRPRVKFTTVAEALEALKAAAGPS